MMFFPGGEGEGRVRVLPIGSGEAGQHGCGAAECSRGRDQLVASWPGLERVAIRMPGIGLGNVETCDNTATTDTGDSMGGGAQRSASRQLHQRSLGPEATAFDCHSNFGYWTSIGSAIIWRATIADMSADV